LAKLVICGQFIKSSSGLGAQEVKKYTKKAVFAAGGRFFSQNRSKSLP
jgi:hypothetical protein